MADSLGEGSEGGNFDQSLTCSCAIQKSHLIEVGVGLDRSMFVLCRASVVSLEIHLLQKQGGEDCEIEPNFAGFRLDHTRPHLKSTVHMLLK